MQRALLSVWSRIVACFLAGVFTILPLAITVAIVVWVARFIDGFIGRETLLGGVLQWLGVNVGGNTTAPYAIGWIVVLSAIFLIGIIVQTGARKILQALMDGVIRRIPLAGSVYNTAAQLVGMIEKKDEADLKRMSVVYCGFGQEHGSGILALLPTRTRFHFGGRDYYSVYVPTSPVPMTGGLLFVPVDSIQPVDITVDGLMSIYLSMGVTGPQFLSCTSQSGEQHG